MYEPTERDSLLKGVTSLEVEWRSERKKKADYSYSVGASTAV